MKKVPFSAFSGTISRHLPWWLAIFILVVLIVHEWNREHTDTLASTTADALGLTWQSAEIWCTQRIGHIDRKAESYLCDINTMWRNRAHQLDSVRVQLNGVLLNSTHPEAQGLLNAYGQWRTFLQTLNPDVPGLDTLTCFANGDPARWQACPAHYSTSADLLGRALAVQVILEESWLLNYYAGHLYDETTGRELVFVPFLSVNLKGLHAGRNLGGYFFLQCYDRNDDSLRIQVNGKPVPIDSAVGRYTHVYNRPGIYPLHVKIERWSGEREDWQTYEKEYEVPVLPR